MHDLVGDGQRDLIGQHTTSQMECEDYNGKPITLQWTNFWDAAADAGRSRLYGGIHIQDGDLGGERLVLRLVRSWCKTCCDQPNRCSSGKGVHAPCFFAPTNRGSAEALYSGSVRFQPINLRFRQIDWVLSCGTCLSSYWRGGCPSGIAIPRSMITFGSRTYALSSRWNRNTQLAPGSTNQPSRIIEEEEYTCSKE